MTSEDYFIIVHQGNYKASAEIRLLAHNRREAVADASLIHGVLLNMGIKTDIEIIRLRDGEYSTIFIVKELLQ